MLPLLAGNVNNLVLSSHSMWKAIIPLWKNSEKLFTAAIALTVEGVRGGKSDEDYRVTQNGV